MISCVSDVEGLNHKLTRLILTFEPLLAFRRIGCGYSAMNEWTCTMNSQHVMSYDTYRNAHQKIANASKETFQEIVKKSRKTIVHA